MKTINFLSVLAVFVVLSALTPAIRSAQDSASHASTANPVKPTAEHQARAKEIFTIDCAMCHGANGNGKTDLAHDMNLALKDWTDPATFGSKTDGQIFDIIRNGIDKMPPETSGRAPDEILWNLVIYVRSISAAPAPAPAAK